MLDKFNNSFYAIWFQSLPEQVIVGAIAEIENEFKHMKRQCRGLYDEFIILSTARFLLTFFDIGAVSVDIEGEQVALKSLNETGTVSYVKKDAIDSSISREYFKQELPAGLEFNQFPAGRMTARINKIQETCKAASRFGLVFTGSNFPKDNCGVSAVTKNKQNKPKSNECCE